MDLLIVATIVLLGLAAAGAGVAALRAAARVRARYWELVERIEGVQRTADDLRGRLDELAERARLLGFRLEQLRRQLAIAHLATTLGRAEEQAALSSAAADRLRDHLLALGADNLDAEAGA